ncbi:hypothetical protein AB1286_26425 [Trinickia sp. NRRL B-1857]|uniref:hypothetical protein n=1 Tax=Trinickia sp. NRRL B-1857 TaxID=3162879 RepID=UPI003D29700A
MPTAVERVPLTIRLLPSAQAPRVQRPERQIRRELAPKPRSGEPVRNPSASKAQSPNVGPRLEPAHSNSEAVRPNEKSFDWQSDLNSITSSRSIRYGRARPALGASSAGAEAAAGSGEAPLAREISKSARADCRNRYAGMGLLALPALALDAARDDGCRW